MRSHLLGQLSVSMFLIACSLRPLSSSEGSESSEVGSSGESETGTSGGTETDSSGESETETSGGTETGTTDESETGTGEEFEPCTCVEEDFCSEAALNDCEVPSPCGTVDLATPDAEVATCVLQLLVDQAHPSRFDYYATYDGGFESWQGTFYILGPGIGIDLECHRFDFSQYLTPAFHAINEPAYFQDCLGKTASVMTGCIFNGLTEMELVPLCTGN